MKRAARRKASGVTLKLAAECTLREAEALKLALLAAEDSSGDFIIDGSGVTRVDTAGLQLLIGFAMRLELTGRRLVWNEVSKPLRSTALQGGLGALLRLPEVVT
jgi:anti-anti-sigma regulatory factor